VNTQNWSRSGVVDAETFSFQVGNLTENSDYHFRIVAENNLGHSDHLQTNEPIKARSPYNVPSKPEGPLVVTNVGISSATVAWKKPLNDGGSPIIGYLIKRRDINRPVWVKCGRVSADTHKANIRDLFEGCQYAVQIFAENAEGLSAPLDSDEPHITPKRPKGPPESPASFECIGVDVNDVTLQWEPPLADGGSQVKKYKLEMCEKGKQARGEARSWTIVKDDISSINTSYNVTNLREGHEYLFRLTAINESGESEVKVLDKPVKPRQKVHPPSQPSGPLKIVSMEDNAVTVSWDGSKDDGGSPITNYVIEIRDVLKAAWKPVATVNSFTHQYKISDLAENDEYFIRVRAQNEANLTSQPLETDSAVLMKSPFSIPSPPKELKLISAGKDKVKLEFKSSDSDGGLSIRSYIIEKRDSNRVTWVKAAKVKPKDDEANVVYTCEIDELTPGASYWFRVIAENQKGKSETCEINELVKLEKEAEKPSKPLEFNASKQKKPNCVLLDWKAPLYDGNDKLSEYIIEEWNSSSKYWEQIATCGPSETSYLINNLRDGLTYKFRISAKNSLGQGEHSLETVEVKMQKNINKPGPPHGPLKYTITDDQTVITLQWGEPKSNGGSKVKRYIVEKKNFESGLSVDWFKIGFTGPDDTSFKIAEYFIEESTFSFRVFAENEAGKSLPLELNEPIIIQRKKRTPEPVSYLRVVEKTVDTVTLRWKSFSVNTYTQAEKFVIEKRDKNSFEWTKAGQTKNETFTVEDLTPNSSYFFRVTAFNEAGQSEPVEITECISLDISNEVPSKPISISVDEITQNSVTLSWISPKNSGAKPITGYKIYKLASINTHWQEVDHVSRSKKLIYTITDLDYNYEYKFKICAVSDIGVGKANETEKIQLKKPISNLNIFKKKIFY
jgi:predicted phage tail protein